MEAIGVPDATRAGALDNLSKEQDPYDKNYPWAIKDNKKANGYAVQADPTKMKTADGFKLQ